MTHPERTSAEEFRQYVPGDLISVGGGQAWKNLLVEIHSRHRVEESLIVAAVAEPMVVSVLSGTVQFEEREFGGKWLANRIEAGRLFLTMSPTPYELRWESIGPEPFVVMHVFIGLPIFAQAVKDVLGIDADVPALREVSGERDPVLTSLLDHLRNELISRTPASPLLVQGIAQSLAVHLVRTYSSPSHFSQVFRREIGVTPTDYRGRQ